MTTIQAKILTVKDKVFTHNNRKESPQCYMKSKYDKDFIYTESSLFQAYNTLDLLKAFTHKKNNDYIEQNPISPDGKKRRKLKKNVELLTEVVINFDKEIFELVADPHKIHRETEKLAIEFFTKELGFQVLCVATHLDEHFRDDKNKRNYHTHITLLNYDFKTHKTVKRTLSKKHLIRVQDVVYEQFKSFGFYRENNSNDDLSQTLETKPNEIKNLEDTITRLQKEIDEKNNLIKAQQEKLLMQATTIKELKPEVNNIEKEQEQKRVNELEEKNKNLSILIKLILQELNLSQDEISNINLHAVDDMKELIYKKLDMLKLYEFLNVGFAPTQEEENLSQLEENFKNSVKTI